MYLFTLLTVLLTSSVCRSAVLKQNSKNSPASIDPVVADRSSSRHRRSIFSVNPQITSIASKEPSIPKQVVLYGKTQMFVQIAADGTVNGTLDCRSKYAKLQLQSMWIHGHRRIKGIETGRYVAMNKNGTLYSTASPNDETIFRQTTDSNSFDTFASAKYYRTTLYDTFISIGRNGKPRSGRTTNSRQNKVKFLIFTGDSC